MKGTEEQIVWAKRLIKIMNEKFEELFEEAPKEKKEEWRILIEKYNIIMQEAYAGDVIDLLSNNNAKDCHKYYHTLYTDTRISGGAVSERILHEVYKKQ